MCGDSEQTPKRKHEEECAESEQRDDSVSCDHQQNNDEPKRKKQKQYIIPIDFEILLINKLSYDDIIPVFPDFDNSDVALTERTVEELKRLTTEK